MKSREEIDAETIGEPRVRKKKKQRRRMKIFLEMLVRAGWAVEEIKIIRV